MTTDPAVRNATEALSPAALAVQIMAKALREVYCGPDCDSPYHEADSLRDSTAALHAAVSDPAVRDALVEAFHESLVTAHYCVGEGCPARNDAARFVATVLSALDPGEGKP